MLIELLVALGIKVLFTEHANIDCQAEMANGCYGTLNGQYVIYLDYHSQDIDHTLYHELGHILFDQDEVVQKMIGDYETLYYWRDTPSEKVADYFAEYALKNSEFSLKYPCLYIYFRDKVDVIIK